MTSIFDFAIKKPATKESSDSPIKSIFDVAQEELPSEEELQIEEPAEEISEEPEEEKGFWQSVASNPLTQSILGLAKRVTAPLDLLKLLTTGEALTDLDELEDAFKKAGKPFDREDYINKVFEASQYFPTQQLAEDLVKEHTGVSLEPKDTFSKLVRNASEIFATGPKGLLKKPAKQVAKRAAGGVGGAVVGEGLKKAGVPESLADLLSYSLGGAAGASKKPFKLEGEQAALQKTAKKHELREFGGLQREKPSGKAVVTPQSQKKATEELAESSKKAIDKVIADKIPIAKQRAMGIDLQDAYNKAYDSANKKAASFDSAANAAAKAKKPAVEIDLQPMLDKIKKKISSIRKSAPSLSPSDKAAISELKKQYKALTLPTKKNPPIYGPQGQVLNPSPTKRSPKKISMEQGLDQYKNFNEEVNGIYRKPEFSGKEEVVKNIYGEMKSDLLDVIDKASPDVGKDLRFANKIFHETSKLNQVEGLVSNAFANGYNPKKLRTILGGKHNRAFLERDLGKGAVKQMLDIANYGAAAEKKVLSVVKNPKTLADLASEMTPLKASLLFAKGTAGLPVVLLHDIPKSIVQRAKGALMLSPKTRQSYSDFLKHSVSPESASFKKASQNLNKAIEEEYGSEKEFLKYLEED